MVIFVKNMHDKPAGENRSIVLFETLTTIGLVHKKANPVILNRGAYINQCYDNGYYDQKVRDDMINAWNKLVIKHRGENPVITTFNQSVTYEGCRYYLTIFTNALWISPLGSTGKNREIKRPLNKRFNNVNNFPTNPSSHSE